MPGLIRTYLVPFRTNSTLIKIERGLVLASCGMKHKHPCIIIHGNTAGPLQSDSRSDLRKATIDQVGDRTQKGMGKALMPTLKVLTYFLIHSHCARRPCRGESSMRQSVLSGIHQQGDFSLICDTGCFAPYATTPAIPTIIPCEGPESSATKYHRIFYLTSRDEIDCSATSNNMHGNSQNYSITYLKSIQLKSNLHSLVANTTLHVISSTLI